ncbi:MAG: cation:dicarboxylase symporter family transporter [Spirochaetaceae bacterium]|jgi:aerobic C4-dicarboxylate transport protein|nr:cation:dicarboxylase symporter family transporter [Spirochaetaceae bacterium]
MKLWTKYLLSSLTAVAIALLIPLGPGLTEILNLMNHYALSLGRYLLFPLTFFSLAIAVTQLRRYKKLGAVMLRLVILTLLSTALFLLIGMVTTLIFNPERIPILMQEDLSFSIIHWKVYLDNIIPGNLFSIFSENASMLLPLATLSFLLGYHFIFDKEQSEPAYNLFDSFSRIFYRINSFFVKYAYIPLFFITLGSMIQIISIAEFQLYGQLLLILSVSSLIILLILYPLTIYIVGGRETPMAHLYAILAPLTSALVSGDLFFNYGILSRHIKENEGIPREIGGLTLPLLTLFARAGTAMVAGSSMLIIISSYSSLEITLLQVIWVFVFSFLLSFALSAAPRMGVYVLLTLLCKFYGRGLEEGYMLLIPILPILSCFAALIDTAVITLVTRLTAFQEDLVDHVSPKHYI